MLIPAHISEPARAFQEVLTNSLYSVLQSDYTEEEYYLSTHHFVAESI